MRLRATETDILRQVNHRLEKLKSVHIKVGYPEDKRPQTPSRTGSGHEPYETTGEVATIAFINDQERPFLKQGVEVGKPKIRKAYGRAVADIMTLKSDEKAAAALVGEVAVGEVKRNIRDGDHKPNKPETIKRKGSSRPLIDTAQMLNSTTFSVSFGGRR